MEVKLTIRAIIRWEQLTGKPFSTMDYSNEEDVMTILYTTQKESSCTLEAFKDAVKSSPALAEKLLKSLDLNGQILVQFQERQTTGETQKGKSTSDAVMMGDMAAMLILGGVDAKYLMDELELCDLPYLITAYENKKKEQMESDRLWTFYSILPHIDAKKLGIKSAMDMYPFPWEEEQIKNTADEAIKADKAIFEAFMNSGKPFIN